MCSGVQTQDILLLCEYLHLQFKVNCLTKTILDATADVQRCLGEQQSLVQCARRRCCAGKVAVRSLLPKLPLEFAKALQSLKEAQKRWLLLVLVECE